MPNSVLFIGDHRAEVDIGNTFEDVGFNLRICLFQSSDQFFRIKAFGGSRAVLVTGSTGVGKVTGALQKMQSVPVPPFTDIRLSNEIHRADQLHAFEMAAVQLRHHGLDLPAVQHSHQDRLDHVVKMVTERNFVAAKLFRLAV